MPTASYAGTEVTVSDEGFFTDPAQWAEAMEPEIAGQEGIPELTDRH
jgi:dissimilatory sulfite reductase related protein